MQTGLDFSLIARMLGKELENKLVIAWFLFLFSKRKFVQSKGRKVSSGKEWINAFV